MLKNLVKRNFSRFVHAKNAVDVVYQDMMASQTLAPPDHGTKEAAEAVHRAWEASKEVLEPRIARRRRADLLTKRLAVLERYRFFFNLPVTLQTAMSQVEQGFVEFSLLHA